ncbi:MAG: DUF4388 domain-containing protein [Actinomycetota bacterium]|nr:DUF4388 domain-containing protein [Actinomycetota bacterium]
MSKRWQSPEKRQFRRFKNSKDNPLRITINKETAEATLQDYSILGAGVQADRKILSAVGRTIEVSCKNPDFHCEAKVIWHGGQKIGLSLARNVEGSLSVFTAPDIFTGLCGAAETGVLEFRRDQAVRKIYLQQGNIVFSSSNQVEDSLGDMLLRKGTITRQQYEKSVELLKTTGRKQGAILVELGALTPNDMIKAVYSQLEEICLGVFSLHEGSFLFHDGPLPDNLLRLKISAPDLIYRGIKRTADKNAVFEAGLREDSVIAPFSYPLHLFQAMKIPSEDKMIMSLADGRRHLSEIVKEAPFPESKTLQTIYALLYARTLELKDQPETSQDAPEESREDAGRSKPATARGAYTGKVEGPVPAGDAGSTRNDNTGPTSAASENALNITKEQITRIDEMHRMLGKYDHYEMLGLWDKKRNLRR